MQAWPGGGLGLKLDTTALLRAAAVVRNRCHIGNRSDTDTQCTQGTNRRFATRTWALDFDVQVLDALFLCSTTRHFRSDLSCKRCRFTRTLEALSTRRSPRQGVALAVGDGDDGVIERRVNVCNAVSNVLADFFAHTLCCAVGLCFSHGGLSILLISSGPLRLCADPCECVHWCVYADRA